MMRVLLLVPCLLASAVAAAGQTPTPVPVPAVPPVPKIVAPVIPPVPVDTQPWITFDKFHLPFVEPFIMEPFEFQLPDRLALEEANRAVERAREEMERAHEFQFFDHDLLQFEVEKAHEAARQAAEDANAALGFTMEFPQVGKQPPPGGQGPQGLVQIAKPVTPFVAARGNEAGAYGSALRSLSRHQYDQAITLFEQVIARKDPRADAAIYWKAFAQFKSAKSADAQASIAQLRRDYPESRYLADAKVLEADARRQAGQPINVEDQAVNDDIKILAIQSMQRTDPERALPLLDGVLNSANSLEVKRRALYVLALSEDPRARQILLRYAKGAGTPDLQPTAISYVASRRDRSTTSQDLREIYDSTQDPALRRVVIEAYGSAGDKAALLSVATNASNPVNLRQTAVSRLSNLATPQEMWALYQKETDAALRLQIVNSLGSMGAIEQLTEIARTDKEPGVRQRAIRSLGGQRAERTGQVLSELYGTNQDRAIRISIIQALAGQNNAAGLVAIARKETNLDLKRQIISQLSNMAPKSPAAADYLMEMLKAN